jgi:hypothetical protein
MKLMNTKVVLTKIVTVWLMGLSLSLSAIAIAWAQESSDAMLTGAFENVVVGPFDGLDLKTREIWIDDMVYILDRSVKVKGTSTKLGLITDLKPGEEVRATLQPNEKTPSIPYVILIERL